MNRPLSRPRRRPALAAALASGVALVAGCGGGDTSDEPRAAAAGPAQTFALARRPDRPVAATWAAPYSRTSRRLDGFGVTIAATFPKRRRAEVIGRELAHVLRDSAARLAQEASETQRSAQTTESKVPPLTPPEAAWLRSHGVPRPGGGIGWAGQRHATAPPVQVLGSTVIVTDLEYVAVYDEHQPYANPLVRALSSLGGKVLVEGDAGGEGSIVADLTCTAPSAAAATLAGDVADYVALPAGFLARPPWYGGGLTPRQRNARRTYRLVAEEVGRRLQRLLADPEITRLGLEVADSTPENGREAFARLQKRLLEHVLAATPDLHDERLDPVVASWWVADQAEAARLNEKAARDPAVLLKGRSPAAELARAERELRRGARVGQLRHERAASGRPFPARGEADSQLYYARVGHAGGTVDIGWASGARIAVFLPALARYLHDGGCTRIAYELVDFDAVRGD